MWCPLHYALYFGWVEVYKGGSHRVGGHRSSQFHPFLSKPQNQPEVSVRIDEATWHITSSRYLAMRERERKTTCNVAIFNAGMTWRGWFDKSQPPDLGIISPRVWIWRHFTWRGDIDLTARRTGWDLWFWFYTSVPARERVIFIFILLCFTLIGMWSNLAFLFINICVCLYFRLKMALAGSLNAADITAALQACSGNISP